MSDRRDELRRERERLVRELDRAEQRRDYTTVDRLEENLRRVDSEYLW